MFRIALQAQRSAQGALFERLRHFVMPMDRGNLGPLRIRSPPWTPKRGRPTAKKEKKENKKEMESHLDWFCHRHNALGGSRFWFWVPFL